jgi:hypothetical protein
VGLDDRLQRRAAQLQDLSEVAHHLIGLLGDAAGRELSGCRVEWHLARDVEQPAMRHRVAVGSDGQWHTSGWREIPAP